MPDESDDEGDAPDEPQEPTPAQPWGRLVREPGTGLDAVMLEPRAHDHGGVPALKRAGAAVPAEPSSFNRCALGRLRACDVVVEDKLVSGCHAHLYCVREVVSVPSAASGAAAHAASTRVAVYLEDASSNGTWVRGAHAREWTKVHNQRRQLESGDEISLLSVVRDAGGAVENFAARRRGAKFTFVAHLRAEGAAHEPSFGAASPALPTSGGGAS